jgi:hypothetical protein
MVVEAQEVVALLLVKMDLLMETEEAVAVHLL